MVCIFQGQSSNHFDKCYCIPGREIPSWLEKVNICDTKVDKIYKVKIQLPGSGCDEWSGIVLCVVFLPTECSQHHSWFREDGCEVAQCPTCGIRVGGPQVCVYDGVLLLHTGFEFYSEYGKVESHHLWLHSMSKIRFRLPKTPGCYIDKNGFRQVELEISTWGGLEVEKFGFRVV